MDEYKIRIIPNREMSSFVLAKMRPSRQGGTSFPAIRPPPELNRNLDPSNFGGG